MGKVILLQVVVEVSENMCSILEHSPELVESTLLMDVGLGKMETQILDLSLSENCYIED